VYKIITAIKFIASINKFHNKLLNNLKTTSYKKTPKTQAVKKKGF